MARLILIAVLPCLVLAQNEILRCTAGGSVSFGTNEQSPTWYRYTMSFREELLSCVNGQCQWTDYRTSTVITTISTIEVRYDGTLSLYNVQMEDAGTYSVNQLCKNGYCSATTSYTLIVTSGTAYSGVSQEYNNEESTNEQRYYGSGTTAGYGGQSQVPAWQPPAGYQSGNGGYDEENYSTHETVETGPCGRYTLRIREPSEWKAGRNVIHVEAVPMDIRRRKRCALQRKGALRI